MINKFYLFIHTSKPITDKQLPSFVLQSFIEGTEHITGEASVLVPKTIILLTRYTTDTIQEKIASYNATNKLLTIEQKTEAWYKSKLAESEFFRAFRNFFEIIYNDYLFALYETSKLTEPNFKRFDERFKALINHSINSFNTVSLSEDITHRGSRATLEDLVTEKTRLCIEYIMYRDYTSFQATRPLAHLQVISTPGMLMPKQKDGSRLFAKFDFHSKRSERYSFQKFFLGCDYCYSLVTAVGKEPIGSLFEYVEGKRHADVTQSSSTTMATPPSTKSNSSKIKEAHDTPEDYAELLVNCFDRASTRLLLNFGRDMLSLSSKSVLSPLEQQTVKTCLFEQMKILFTTEEVLQLSETDRLIVDGYIKPFDSKTTFLTPDEQCFILKQTVCTPEGKEFRRFLDVLFKLSKDGKLPITEAEIHALKQFHDLNFNNKVQLVNSSGNSTYVRETEFFDEQFKLVKTTKRYVSFHIIKTEMSGLGIRHAEEITPESTHFRRVELVRKLFLVRKHILQENNIDLAQETPLSSPSAYLIPFSPVSVPLQTLIGKTEPDPSWRLNGEAKQFWGVVDGVVTNLGIDYENPVGLRSDDVMELGEDVIIWTLTQEFQRILKAPSLEGARFFCNQQYRPQFRALITILKQGPDFTAHFIRLAHFDPIACSRLGLKLSIPCDSSFTHALANLGKGFITQSKLTETQFHDLLTFLAELSSLPIPSGHPKGYQRLFFESISALKKAGTPEQLGLFRKYGTWFATFLRPELETILVACYDGPIHLQIQILHEWLVDAHNISIKQTPNQDTETKEHKEQNELQQYQKAIRDMIRWLLERPNTSAQPSVLSKIRQKLKKPLVVLPPPNPSNDSYVCILDTWIMKEIVNLWQIKISSIVGVSNSYCFVKEEVKSDYRHFEIMLPTLKFHPHCVTILHKIMSSLTKPKGLTNINQCCLSITHESVFNVNDTIIDLKEAFDSFEQQYNAALERQLDFLFSTETLPNPNPPRLSISTASYVTPQFNQASVRIGVFASAGFGVATRPNDMPSGSTSSTPNNTTLNSASSTNTNMDLNDDSDNNGPDI